MYFWEILCSQNFSRIPKKPSPKFPHPFLCVARVKPFEQQRIHNSYFFFFFSRNTFEERKGTHHPTPPHKPAIVKMPPIIANSPDKKCPSDDWYSVNETYPKNDKINESSSLLLLPDQLPNLHRGYIVMEVHPRDHVAMMLLPRSIVVWALNRANILSDTVLVGLYQFSIKRTIRCGDHLKGRGWRQEGGRKKTFFFLVCFVLFCFVLFCFVLFSFPFFSFPFLSFLFFEIRRTFAK